MQLKEDKLTDIVPSVSPNTNAINHHNQLYDELVAVDLSNNLNQITLKRKRYP